jgi:hypothetical protein
MRPGKVILLSALTTIGGTLLFRKVKTRVPGFSPQG